MITKESKNGKELIRRLHNQYPFLKKDDVIGVVNYANDEEGINKIIKYMDANPNIEFKYIVGYCIHMKKERKQTSHV